MSRIRPDEMFNLKKGTKILLKDDEVVELTSDYIQESVSYKCRYECSDTESTISTLKLNGAEVLN